MATLLLAILVAPLPLMLAMSVKGLLSARDPVRVERRNFYPPRRSPAKF